MQIRFIVVLLLLVASLATAQDSTLVPAEISTGALVRVVRCYGEGDELQPPILIRKTSANAVPVFGSRSLMVELDIQASIPPSLYARFVHCNALWQEDNNVFLNDISLRTSAIDWKIAPTSGGYYSHRATLSFPNSTVVLPAGGNWKILFYNYDAPDSVFAEARFFAIDVMADCIVDVYADFYEPKHKAANVAVNLQATVFNTENAVMDGQVSTCVFYKRNRWNEPFVCTQQSLFSSQSLFGKRSRTNVSGMSQVQKQFRYDGIPAETDYRILDLTNTLLFAPSREPIRLPLSDVRRFGSFLFTADDGAMISSGVPAFYDDYVPIEFVFDPQGKFIPEDVFVSGSFNSFTPTHEWQMSYNEQRGLYTLQKWIRRAKHNYFYATGTLNADTREVQNISYEECEGNNASAGHLYIALVYYRSIQLGGFDTIIAVGAGNIYGSARR